LSRSLRSRSRAVDFGQLEHSRAPTSSKLLLQRHIALPISSASVRLARGAQANLSRPSIHGRSQTRGLLRGTVSSEPWARPRSRWLSLLSCSNRRRWFRSPSICSSQHPCPNSVFHPRRLAQLCFLARDRKVPREDHRRQHFRDQSQSSRWPCLPQCRSPVPGRPCFSGSPLSDGTFAAEQGTAFPPKADQGARVRRDHSSLIAIRSWDQYPGRHHCTWNFSARAHTAAADGAPNASPTPAGALFRALAARAGACRMDARAWGRRVRNLSVSRIRRRANGDERPFDGCSSQCRSQGSQRLRLLLFASSQRLCWS
jgi:hypothetical protein